MYLYANNEGLEKSNFMPLCGNMYPVIMTSNWFFKIGEFVGTLF